LTPGGLEVKGGVSLVKGRVVMSDEGKKKQKVKKKNQKI